MKLSDLAHTFKRELAFYRAVAAHPRTPKTAKWLLVAAIGYALLPFDLIPDFLPIIGHLDDAVIIPGLIYLALKRVPKTIYEECRAAVVSPAEAKPQVK
ncbi:MAG TPA: YkvA family protein [Abditibacterium sp.]|jgi:uncharacterized membrane protein YkvA (DUF1232 family)